MAKPLPTPDRPRARDHRIDGLRGLALVSIFINHMPGNRFENWTTRNFGFSDAAEVFVLLAGVAAAFAFFPVIVRGDWAAVGIKALRRAGMLYSMHLLSTLSAVAVFVGAAWLVGNDGILELIGIAPILAEPWTGLAGVLMGGHMLGVSLGLYLAAHLLPIDMPNFPADEGWFFNPFAWQLLFAIGIALGIAKLRNKGVPWHPVAGVVAALYVTFSAVWMVGDMGGRVSFDLLPMWMDTLHKSMLPASRLLHVLALAYLLVHSPLWTWGQRVGASNPLVLLGRNSLPVFVLGSLLSMVGYILLVQSGSNLWLESALTLGGVVVMVGFAVAVEQRLPQRAFAWGTGRLRPVTAVELDDPTTTTTQRR
jgi:hypothetical protein